MTITIIKMTLVIASHVQAISLIALNALITSHVVSVPPAITFLRLRIFASRALTIALTAQLAFATLVKLDMKLIFPLATAPQPPARQLFVAALARCSFLSEADTIALVPALDRDVVLVWPLAGWVFGSTNKAAVLFSVPTSGNSLSPKRDAPVPSSPPQTSVALVMALF